jgi:splicing factor 3B subunit 3
MFFFLIQTEQGDLFKVTLEVDEDIVSGVLNVLNQFSNLDSFFQVTEIKIKYFDTVPVANSMCVLKTGFLFVASEFGNQ